MRCSPQQMSSLVLVLTSGVLLTASPAFFSLGKRPGKWVVALCAFGWLITSVGLFVLLLFLGFGIC